MRLNEAQIFVFIASIIIGILISTNIDFGKTNPVTLLSVNQYQEAYEERSRLYNEVSALQKKYYEYNKKIREYELYNKDKYEIIEDIQKEVKDNKFKAGMTDVEGPGIAIILKDNQKAFEEDGDRLHLIHDEDIINVVNELKNAGAEAVSVNGQRVIDRSNGFCGGTTIDFDGVKIVAPFNITAIGNKEVLMDYMTKDESYLTMRQLNGKIKVDINEKESIVIDAYIGKKKYKYVKSKISKE